jgi:hypothetical protein
MEDLHLFLDNSVILKRNMDCSMSSIKIFGHISVNMFLYTTFVDHINVTSEGRQKHQPVPTLLSFRHGPQVVRTNPLHLGAHSRFYAIAILRIILIFFSDITSHDSLLTVKLVPAICLRVCFASYLTDHLRLTSFRRF